MASGPKDKTFGLSLFEDKNMHEQKIGKRPIVRNKTGKPKLDCKTAFGKGQGGFQKMGGKKASAK